MYLLTCHGAAAFAFGARAGSSEEWVAAALKAAKVPFTRWANIPRAIQRPKLAGGCNEQWCNFVPWVSKAACVRLICRNMP